MPRGRQTSADIQWTVIRLSRSLDHERIAMAVDLSIRSVRRIISHFRDYGTIPNPEKIPIQARGNRSQVPAAAGINPNQQPSIPYNSQTGAYGYYPPPAAPVIIMQPPTPWGAPVQAPDGSWYQSPAQAALPALPPHLNLVTAQRQSSPLGTQSTSDSRSLSPANSMPSTTARKFSSIDHIPDSETPEIITWFASLDEHEVRKKDFKFAPFGQHLYDEGFRYLSQLSPSILSLDELATSMGTLKGTAAFVRHYAKQDLEALL